jgi:hypothetical protein
MRADSGDRQTNCITGPLPQPLTRPRAPGCAGHRRVRASSFNTEAARNRRREAAQRTSAPSSPSSSCSQLSLLIWFSAPRFFREGSSAIVARRRTAPRRRSAEAGRVVERGRFVV